MKAIVAFILISVMATGANAGDKADKKLAIEYLKVSRIEQVANATVETYSQQLLKDSSEPDRTNLRQLMHETIGWDAIKDQLADLVIEEYTKAELKAAIAFMKSPLGASAMAKSESFSSKFATLVSQNFLKFVREHPVQPNPSGSQDPPSK